MAEQGQPNSGQSQSGVTIQLTPQQMLFIALSIIGLVLVCLFGFLLLDPFGWLASEEETPENSDTAVVDDSLSPSDAQTEDVIVVFDGSNTLSIDLDPPTSLNLKNRIFSIQPEFVASNEGVWNQSATEDGSVEWVFGSIINQIYGFPSSEENDALLQQIVPGDRVAITYQSGEQKEFVITGRELSDLPNNELFVQNRPGLRLVALDNEEAGRLIISADFALPDTDSGSNNEASVATVGETVQLSDLRIVVSDTSIATNDPSLPPGFALFLVNYQIENIGAGALDTGLLRFVLSDENGNLYSLNPIATQSGNFPLLTGSLEQGINRQASAGYQIPANLVSDSLTWSVNRVDSPGQIEVNIPFTRARSDNAVVNIDRAEVSLDGTSVLISGQIQNQGEFPLVINENDLMLESDGTVYLILSTTLVSLGQLLQGNHLLTPFHFSGLFLPALRLKFWIKGLRLMVFGNLSQGRRLWA